MTIFLLWKTLLSGPVVPFFKADTREMNEMNVKLITSSKLVKTISKMFYIDFLLLKHMHPFFSEENNVPSLLFDAIIIQYSITKFHLKFKLQKLNKSLIQLNPLPLRLTFLSSLIEWKFINYRIELH